MKKYGKPIIFIALIQLISFIILGSVLYFASVHPGIGNHPMFHLIPGITAVINLVLTATVLILKFKRKNQ